MSLVTMPTHRKPCAVGPKQYPSLKDLHCDIISSMQQQLHNIKLTSLNAVKGLIRMTNMSFGTVWSYRKYNHSQQ